MHDSGGNCVGPDLQNSPCPPAVCRRHRLSIPFQPTFFNDAFVLSLCLLLFSQVAMVRVARSLRRELGPWRPQSGGRCNGGGGGDGGDDDAKGSAASPEAAQAWVVVERRCRLVNMLHDEVMSVKKQAKQAAPAPCLPCLQDRCCSATAPKKSLRFISLLDYPDHPAIDAPCSSHTACPALGTLSSQL
jgi:hypothetical protein